MKGNIISWLIVIGLLAVTYFSWLNLPLYKNTMAIKAMQEKGNAVLHYQLGVLTQEEKEYIMKTYGWTEKDFNVRNRFENEKDN